MKQNHIMSVPWHFKGAISQPEINYTYTSLAFISLPREKIALIWPRRP